MWKLCSPWYMRDEFAGHVVRPHLTYTDEPVFDDVPGIPGAPLSPGTPLSP